MNDNEMYQYLDVLIANFLKENTQTLTQNYETYINDKLVQINLWSEYIDNHLIQIFEIKIKRTLFEQVYAKGVLFDETGYQILDNEKLWEYGF